MRGRQLGGAALASALVMFAAGSAEAVTSPYVNVYTFPTVLSPTAQSVNLSIPPGSFAEYLNFYVGANDSVSALVQNVTFSLPGSTLLNVANLASDLYAGTAFISNGSVAGIGANPIVGSPFNSPSLSTTQSNTLSGTLGADSFYSLEITGNATGSTGGDIVAAVAAVPEPAVSTLMGVGLALVGFIAVTKKQRG